MSIPQVSLHAIFPTSLPPTPVQTVISAAVTSAHLALTATMTPPATDIATISVTTIASATSPIITPSTEVVPPAKCDWPGCWYNGYWAGPLTWLILCYCLVSAFIMFSLWCGGYLDWKLNLRDPYRGDPYSTSRGRQPQSTNEIWYYQQHQYRQRQRDRAAARRHPAANHFEELQRQYAAAGIHVSPRELRYQLRQLEGAPPAMRSQRDQSSSDTLDELRALERERRDAIVMEKLRRQGLI